MIWIKSRPFHGLKRLKPYIFFLFCLFNFFFFMNKSFGEGLKDFIENKQPVRPEEEHSRACPELVEGSGRVDKDFIESFIGHYEFNAEGRYAHEYHPVLLEKTALSLDELEDELAKQGMNLAGRIVISGYEENAVPSYYTDYKKAKIDDEASSKSNVGWSLRLHNRFGFMTGFLFKDINCFSQHWFKDKDSFFEHIDPQEVEIFDDKATIFQEHAFGEALSLILRAQDAVLKKFKQQDFRGVFKELIHFWNYMYKGEIKIGNKQIAGTQDILFSIEYAKHLVRSSLPLLTCFVGPDITYPIEVSVSQKKEATIHAQNFVKHFEQRLIPHQDKPTVYVFCSFVDGVGKSTLLGNVKNYLKYQKDVEKFERVDNSSSQLADLFKLKENVFIADLPAQVSHFTYKPDGFVYVSVERDLDEQRIEELQKFARQNKDALKKNYKNLLEEIKTTIEQEGYFAATLNSEKNPEKVFLKNLVLLKKDKTNRWIPFQYQGENFLFNLYEPSKIRVLVPLGQVQSEGLKNIETEQMLFFDGIHLPISYRYFLQDFISKLKNEGIQDVIFVDFISMYPRSSRENIRINYLLQQMALLNCSFDSKYSLYRDFVSEAELFALLKYKESFEWILSSFRLETEVRLALFNLIAQREEGSLDGFSLKQLTNLIKNELEKVDPENRLHIQELTLKKLKLESYKLEDLYGLTKAFVNVQQFYLKEAMRFSEHIGEFFYRYVDNDRLNELWQDPGNILDAGQEIDNGVLDKIVTTDKNTKVRALYDFDLQCRDEQLLASFLRTLRSSFYALFSNLFDVRQISSDFFRLEKEKYFVPPFFLKKGEQDKIYLVQRLFDNYEEELTDETKKIENIFNLCKLENALWGEFKDFAYLLDWKCPATNAGIYAYDCNLASTKKFSFNKSIITFLVQKYQKEHGQEMVMPTSKLYEELKQSEMWKDEWRKMVSQAKQNGEYSKKDDPDSKKKQQEKEKFNYDFDMLGQNKNKIKIFLGGQEQAPAARLLIRMLTTLEMIIKDPDADIAIRFGDQEDFKAALKLMQKTTLPKYFGILFLDDLFDDYDDVEPCTF